MENKEINQAEWESANQQIYSLKREVERLTFLEKDYISEIEALQGKHLKEKRELQAKINVLDDEKRTLAQKTKLIEEIEQELLLKCDEIKVLKKQLESASKTVPQIDNFEEFQRLTSKLHILEEENLNLGEENNKIKNCIMDLEQNVQNYEGTISSLREDYDSLSENYKCKVEDLTQTKEMVETLQDELMVTKTELEIIKNKSAENSGQGNSLFAEVDDKRLQLQSKVNKMKNHYEQMKQQVVRLEDQIFKMRIENGTLKQNWEKEIEERASDKYDVEEGYKQRIFSLETLIKDYKTELESRPLVSTKTMKQEELAFIEYRLELKNNEIQKLLDKIDKNSFSNMILTERNREASKEVSTWQLKYINTKNELDKKGDEITKLEEKIRELEIEKNSPEARLSAPYVDFSRLHKRSCSLMQEKKEFPPTINEDSESHKENQAGVSNVRKKVQFLEGTKESEHRDNKTYRRGGKTIICQPTALKKREF